MTYPHQLPSLIGLSPDPNLVPLLIIGSGLSYGQLETAKELAHRLAQKLTAPVTCKAESPDKCYLRGEDSAKECLYCVAEEKLKELEKVNNHLLARIQLAKELGLFDLRTWFGDADLPLGRNYPKHRAIARLAADERFSAIVCLNWDCFLEAALKAIGLSENETNPDRPGKIKRFAIIVGDDKQLASRKDMFRLFKPHGCVQDLQEQLVTQPHKEPIFKITHSDLSNIKSNSDVAQEIKLKWKGRPLIACGWSASEDYLKDIAKDVKSECCRIETGDRLTVIDKKWQGNHDHIASCYNTDKDQAFFDITNSDTDFFWMSTYTRYAVQKMRNYASRDIIQQLDALLAGTPDKSDAAWNCAIQFCDNFLSSWNRLCWRLGAVKCFREDQTQIPSSHIPLVPLDWYVPFDTHVGAAPDQRPDLQAAGILLAELLKIKETNPWRFDDFPGCLWHKDNEVLLFPVPTFLPDYNLIDLSAMKSLIEASCRFNSFARIKSVHLLKLSNDHKALEITQSDIITRAFSSVMQQILPLEALLTSNENEKYNFSRYKDVDIKWIVNGGIS